MVLQGTLQGPDLDHYYQGICPAYHSFHSLTHLVGQGLEGVASLALLLKTVDQEACQV